MAERVVNRVPLLRKPRRWYSYDRGRFHFGVEVNTESLSDLRARIDAMGRVFSRANKIGGPYA